MSRHKPESRCTPLAEWPRLDRDAWQIALEPADPLDLSVGYAQRWAENTRRVTQNGYGHWLAWLARTGQLEPLTAPGERVTQERVRAYLEMMRKAGLADNTCAGRLQQLCNTLRAIAQQQDWTWIHRASSRIYATAVLVRDPTERMQPSEAVLALGHDLMHAAEHDRFRTALDRATLFRDGLLLAFLVQRPFRLANLASLAFGEHLQKIGPEWHIYVPGRETKTGEAIGCLWPASLHAALESYIEVYREELLRTSKMPKRVSALWISRHAKSMCPAAISVQIKLRTGEDFGKTINPHIFRHIAATTIATSNPEGSMDIKGVLGHATIATSEKHYNRATRRGAFKDYQTTVDELRRRRA